MGKFYVEKQGDITICTSEAMLKSEKRWNRFEILMGRGMLSEKVNNLADKIIGKCLNKVGIAVIIILFIIAVVTALDAFLELPEGLSKLAWVITGGDLEGLHILIISTAVIAIMGFTLKVIGFIGTVLGSVGMFGALSAVFSTLCYLLDVNKLKWIQTLRRFIPKLQFVDWDYYMHIFMLLSIFLFGIAIIQTVIYKIVDKVSDVSYKISRKRQERAETKNFLKKHNLKR